VVVGVVVGVLVVVGVATGVAVSTDVAVGVGACAVSVATTLPAIAVSVALRSGVVISRLTRMCPHPTRAVVPTRMRTRTQANFSLSLLLSSILGLLSTPGAEVRCTLILLRTSETWPLRFLQTPTFRKVWFQPTAALPRTSSLSLPCFPLRSARRAVRRFSLR
jgi:hypothetical protein